MIADVSSGRADPLSSMAKVIAQHPDTQSMQAFSSAIERQRLQPLPPCPIEIFTTSQSNQPVTQAPNQFQFDIAPQRSPQVTSHFPEPVLNPATAMVPYVQPKINPNNDDNLWEGCSRDTHYPTLHRSLSAHPYVRDPTSWSGQMCCIRCGKADHYVSQCSTNSAQHLACWEQGYLHALIAPENRRDGSGSKGPTGLMYTAKRFYDDASLPLPAGTNPTAKPSRRREDAWR
ncbi:hypothetical protein K3495_g4762 [Podosphaera aphanis]|nr:hypothetical protein K3495_g4762 [Podosphaera aphanis]